jgi:hypothetical protein
MSREVMPASFPVIDGREAAGVERVGALAPDGGDLAFATAGKGGVHDLITLAGNAARVAAIADFGAAAPGVKVTGGGDFRATEAVDQATALVRTGRLHVPIAQTFTSRTRPTPTASARTGTSAASSYSSRADARSADEGRTLSFAIGAAERRELRDGPEQRSRAGPSHLCLAVVPAGCSSSSLPSVMSVPCAAPRPSVPVRTSCWRVVIARSGFVCEVRRAR